MRDAFKLAPEDWAILRGLLDEALELPAAAREAWLASLDEARARGLKTRLQDLLAHAGREPTAARLMDTLPKVETANFAPPPGSAAGQPGNQVGPYRLIRELGSGGMGSVWLAERTDMLQRRPFALKLPHGAWRRAGLAERMAREREILAALDHPNIARLYDAGVDADGQPYLAIEYVDGERLDEHCSRLALSVPQRLRLFVQVVQAVAHAHAQLVVHRDLKPGNILVSQPGSVKLLDFGIAKLLDHGVATDTALTREAGRALTPDYASPEQVLGQPVGTASDIYSLGVLLFELLADQRPYRLGRPSRAALEDAITQAEVARPSALAPRERRSEIRGDLDAIVGKALKRLPSDRYATAAALADDVQRWLEHRPVLATPDSLGYRLRRFVRRHLLPLSATAAVGIALMAAAITALWQAQQARVEQSRAAAVKAFVAQMLTDANPFSTTSKEPTVEALLLAAEQRLPTTGEGSVALRVELLTLIGSGLTSLGKQDAAERALARAIDEGQRLLGADHVLTLRARVEMLTVYRLRGREDRMAPELADLLPRLRAGGDALAEPLAGAISASVFLAIDQGRHADAHAAASEAYRIAARALGPEHFATVSYAIQVASTEGMHGDPVQALQTAARTRELVERVHGRHGAHGRVLDVRFLYGNALAKAGRADDAVVELKETLAQVQSVLGPQAPMAGYVAASIARLEFVRGDAVSSARHAELALAIKALEVDDDSYAMAFNRAQLARAQVALHRGGEALRTLERAMPSMSKARGPESLALAELVAMRALAHALSGDLAAAERDLDEWIERVRKEKPSPGKAEALHMAGTVKRLAGHTAPAVQLQEQALAALPERPALALRRDAVIDELAWMAVLSGDAAAARAWLARRSKPLATSDAIGPAVALRQMTMGRILLVEGRNQEAVPWLDRADAFWRRHQPDSPFAGEAAHWLSRALAGAGRGEDAARARERAALLLERAPLPGHRELLASR